MKALSAICVLMIVVSAANAAYITGWSPTPTLTDANDLAILDSQDILKVWYTADATNHYFRMDLQGVPSGASYSGIYGIYIDAVAGGASGGDYTYIPNALSGVDFIVDSHFDDLSGAFNQWDFHIYDDGAESWSYGVLDGHQESENGGITLEWKIAKSKIGTEYTFRAATHDGGSSTTTYDYAPDVSEGGFYVPEPASLSLLVIGGMALLRKRRI